MLNRSVNPELSCKRFILLLLFGFLITTLAFADYRITRGPDIGEIYFVGPTVTGEGIYHSTDFGETAVCVDSISEVISICADKTQGCLYRIRMPDVFYYSNNYGQYGSWVFRHNDISSILSGRKEGFVFNGKAITYAKKGYKIEKSTYMAHTYTMILLWNNEIEEALRISKDFMENKEAYEKFPKDIRQFLMLLIAKKQYHSALKIFNVNPFKLKDRFKPVYYALMYFLQKEYPNEYIKMGSELKQTVEEIIAEIGKMAKDYS